VGTPKAACMAAFAAATAPFVAVDAVAAMVTAENARDLLAPVGGRAVDLVVDCIDDVETKSALLAECVRAGVPVLTATGAGGKCDPTRLCVAPLADAVHDPLAVKLRWRLRQRGVDYGGADLEKGEYPAAAPAAIKCVYSYEAPRATLLPLSDDQVREGAANFGAVDVDHFRVRVMPVLGPAPALAGHALAAIALCDLAGAPVAPKTREPLSRKVKIKMVEAFRKREICRERGPKALPEHCDWVDLVPEDVEHVVNDARTAAPPLPLFFLTGSARRCGAAGAR